MNVPILPKAGKLPLVYEFTPANYRSLLLQRLKLYLSGDNVLLGRSVAPDATIAPLLNIGAWYNPDARSWRAWNWDTGEYKPIEIGFVNGNFGMTINASPTANRTITLPDATGTVATTADALVPRATVVLTGATPIIDASTSSDFYLELSGNTTIQPITNMPTGGKIKICLANTGTSYTVTWPTAGADEVKWPATPSHTQPTATPGQRALGIYTIREINAGLTPHLWGDPEVSGFNAPVSPVTGGTEDVSDYYGGGALPPPKGRNPYNLP